MLPAAAGILPAGLESYDCAGLILASLRRHAGRMMMMVMMAGRKKHCRAILCHLVCGCQLQLS